MCLLPCAREEDELDVSLNILERNKTHWLIGLGHVRTHSRDQTRDAYLLFVLCLTKLTREVADDLRKDLLVRCERMVRDVKADEFALPIQHLAFIYVVDIGEADLIHNACRRAEQTHLSSFGSPEVITADGYYTI